jgi:hypothetical protein
MIRALSFVAAIGALVVSVAAYNLRVDRDAWRSQAAECAALAPSRSETKAERVARLKREIREDADVWRDVLTGLTPDRPASRSAKSPPSPR